MSRRCKVEIPRSKRIAGLAVLFIAAALWLMVNTVWLFAEGIVASNSDSGPIDECTLPWTRNGTRSGATGTPCHIQHSGHANNLGTDTNHTSVLYYNTHGGALDNLRAVMSRLSLRIDNFNPNQIAGYGMSRARAQRLVNSGHAWAICSQYDVVVIGDTIPHARAILLSLLDPRPSVRCQSRVVVEMTNRFNWDVKDKKSYYAMFRSLAKEASPGGTLHNRLFWVANNNVEQAFVEHHIQAKLHQVRLLRPVGASRQHAYPSDLDVPTKRNFAARTHDTTHIFEIMRDQYKIPISIIPFGHKYGGPHHLVKFKAFIDVPYQYSVMKFYENIAFGVPVFVPTPMFYESLVKDGLHFTHCIHLDLVKQFPEFPKTALVPINGFPAWSVYFDYYDPLFSQYIYYFDSFQELQELSMNTRQQNSQFEDDDEALDWKGVRTRGPLFYAGYRETILEGWAEMFREMGFVNVTPYLKGEVPFFERANAARTRKEDAKNKNGTVHAVNANANVNANVTANVTVNTRVYPMKHQLGPILPTKSENRGTFVLDPLAKQSADAAANRQPKTSDTLKFVAPSIPKRTTLLNLNEPSKNSEKSMPATAIPIQSDTARRPPVHTGLSDHLLGPAVFPAKPSAASANNDESKDDSKKAAPPIPVPSMPRHQKPVTNAPVFPAKPVT
ncbi:hypothetical protein CcCBS67573_g07141 [Chytriomyces confervae]|uniref:Uncharacterized protein n=1 Tax=Chytriomyces confervae TaxID=246404 RepID=A0A507EZQ6_9FUNG|nr:hypothetical protein HDU80_003001 [Chytriomyces hyalinus]TPX68618.1 hypothetical protein CcCBS67573_g07141 [Chytriomyces confervae]